MASTKINFRRSPYALAFLYFLFLSNHALPNSTYQDPYSQSTYGGVGLIQMPTARSSPEGEFGFGVSTEGTYNRIYSRMQFFPWLEANLRYTEGEYKAYNPGDRQTWKDKGIDLKAQILREQDHGLSFAIGLLDLGGTGAFSSEYIVASKRIGDIDLTAGLAWGGLAGINHFDNLLTIFDDSRKKRGGGIKGGGQINFKRLFSGKNNSVFGGIEYFTPINNLSLKLEYDTSDYSEVEGKFINFMDKGEIFRVDSRLNYALNYRLNVSERDKLDFSLGFVRGNTLYANLSIHSNLNFSGIAKTIMGAEVLEESQVKNYQKLNQGWKDYVTKKIMFDMAFVGFVTHQVIFKDNELIAEISQSRFLETTFALDLASRILAKNAPKETRILTVVNIDKGIETLRSSVDKDTVISSVRNGALPENTLEFDTDYGQPIFFEQVNNKALYPNFYWEVKPHLNTTFQHQVQFFFWQLEALFHAEYSIKKGLYLISDIGVDIASNFENYTFHVPDGKLHHVRQDRRLYLTEGESGLRRLVLDYMVDISPNIKAQFSAGYLEPMFGGIGGEILYLSDSRHWGVGIDTYWVKQREFDQKFSFRDYETVTGFLSYYRDIPFYDLRLKISTGKFLGKDVGSLIDISRRFKTGARVGAFAALTDCDAACVGEGSFHKGIYFDLPMDLFYNSRTTRQRAGYSWAPLNKDAGARIDRGNLYGLVKGSSDEVDSLRLKNFSAKKIFSGFGTKPKQKI